MEAKIAKRVSNLVNPRVRPLPQPFSAVLLAGGKSTRMGQEKASLMIDGFELWARQWATLTELRPCECFISGGSAGPWRGAGIETVEDTIREAGPLGGLTAALQRMRSSWLLVLAVDLPDVHSGILRILLERAMIRALGQVPAVGDWCQPLAAVYPQSTLALARECLGGADRSMRNFLRAAVETALVERCPIRLDEQRCFRNLNTPEDLRPFADSGGA